MLEEDFDGEEFATDINNELEEEKINRLDSFACLTDTEYAIHSETFHNIYENMIDVRVHVMNDISEESLLMECDFNVNCKDFSPEKFTTNDYDPSEFVELMMDVYDDLLDEIYKKDSDLLHKFSKADLEHMLKKYPEDDFIKSVAGGSKFKIFDSFIEESNGKKLLDDQFLHEITNHLNHDYMTYIEHYAEDYYIIGSQIYQELSDEHLYVSIYEIEDGLKLDFDSNTDDNEIEEVSMSSIEIASTLNDLFEDWLIRKYEEDKEILFKLKDHKEAINFLEERFPNDNYLRSVLSGNKFKVFDSFLNEYLSKEEEETGEVETPQLPPGGFADIYTDEEEVGEAHDLILDISTRLGNEFGEVSYFSRGEYDVTGKITDQVTNRYIYFDVNIENIGTEDRYYSVEFDTKNKELGPETYETSSMDSNEVADFIKEELMKIYQEHYDNNDDIDHIDLQSAENVLKLFPDYEKAQNLVTSLKAGKKYKILDFYTYSKKDNQ